MNPRSPSNETEISHGRVSWQTRKTHNEMGPLASSRGCVKSHCDAQNRSKKTIETLSRKIKTSYRSSLCVRFFALGLITQPRDWLDRGHITGGCRGRRQSEHVPLRAGLKYRWPASKRKE